MSHDKRPHIPWCPGAHGWSCPLKYRVSKSNGTDGGYNTQCVKCFKACPVIKADGTVCFRERHYKYSAAGPTGELHPTCTECRPQKASVKQHETTRKTYVKFDRSCPGIPALEAYDEYVAVQARSCGKPRKWKVWDDDHPERRELHDHCPDCGPLYATYLAEKTKREEIRRKVEQEKEKWIPHTCVVNWGGKSLSIERLNPDQQLILSQKEREEVRIHRAKAFTALVETTNKQLAEKDKHACPRCIEEKCKITEVSNDDGCWCKKCTKIIPICKRCRDKPVDHEFDDNGALVIISKTHCEECEARHKKHEPPSSCGDDASYGISYPTDDDDDDDVKIPA